MKYISAIIVAITLSCAASAEIIKVPVGQQTNSSEITRPARGMKKDQVREFFGEPISQTSATGTPPITNWKYQGFTVYFEYDHVIHTVLTHQRQDSSADE